MKETLNYLFENNTLSKKEAKSILLEIGQGKHNNSQIASFMTIFCMRAIHTEEISGFREAMLELSLQVNLKEYQAMDIVGTGGDNKNSFNISTASAFVVAGSGISVSKHGNYGVSSGCGASNLLEYFGVKFSNKEEDLKRMLDRSCFCMLHAPLFHPAMKYVAPIRKELGVRTFFNMLGPLTNPSLPKIHVLGVFNLELGRLYSYVYQNTNENYAILHSLDGYDEISLTAPVKIFNKEGETTLNPEDFGFSKLQQKDIEGGNSIESSAKIFEAILKNEATESQKNVVLANAGMAIKLYRGNISLAEGLTIAKESLESGKAFACFKAFIN